MADLREAAALDLGDWFRFEIGPPRPLADTGGVRLPVKAFVGNTEWAAFHVDLVGEDLRMTGDPEDVPPLARVVMPDVEQHGYRAFCGSHLPRAVPARSGSRNGGCHGEQPDCRGISRSLPAREKRRAVAPEPMSLRWILVHMIEETGRHAGHADILREQIDGSVGR